MSKAHSVALILLIATLLVPAAQADDWWAGDRQTGLDPAIATAIRDRAETGQELRGVGSQPQPGQRTAIQQIIAQERARNRDLRLFDASDPAPIQIVQTRDGFDMSDAGIGGATVLALVLLGTAAMAVRNGNRRPAASSES